MSSKTKNCAVKSFDKSNKVQKTNLSWYYREIKKEEPGFVNQDREREISPFGPANDMEPGIYISSPIKYTGMGPYFVQEIRMRNLKVSTHHIQLGKYLL